MHKKISSLLIVLLLPVLLVAQIPAGYYSGANGKSGATLKTALYSKITSHTARSYSSLWTDFQSTDSRSNGKVWDMYSNCTFTWGTNQDKGSGGTSECQFYNREHSFPKSWFNDASPMYTDLFHLIPADKYVNGRRGNMAYGEVGSASETFINGSKVGGCSYSGCSGTVFEPIDEYKGDLARNYFYMVTCYENVVAGWYNNAEAKSANMINGTAYPAFQTWAVNLLLKWHRQDPVSQKELDRNNAVYGIQGNRNPFIDHPELAEYIWGNKKDTPWSDGGQTAINTTRSTTSLLYPNPAENEVNIRLADNVELYRVEIFDMQGMLRLVRGGSMNYIDISPLNAGVYVVRITTNQGVAVQLLQKK